MWPVFSSVFSTWTYEHVWRQNPKCVTSQARTISVLLNLSWIRRSFLVFPGGFQAFQKSYPELCAGLADSEESTILGLRNLQILDSENPEGDDESGVPSPKSEGVFPVQVLPYLFLGNAQNSADPDCLERNGITYILNVTPNVPNSFEDDGMYHYKQIPINDHWSQNLAMFFPEAIAFIGEF